MDCEDSLALAVWNLSMSEDVSDGFDWLEDGEWHDVVVESDPLTDTVTVTVDGEEIEASAFTMTSSIEGSDDAVEESEELADYSGDTEAYVPGGYSAYHEYGSPDVVEPTTTTYEWTAPDDVRVASSVVTDEGIKELADRMRERDVVGDLLGGPDKHVYEMKRRREQATVSMESKVPAEDLDADFETKMLDVDEEMAEAVVESICDRVEAAENEYGRIERLVLGVPQYKVLLAWCQTKYGQDPGEYLTLDVIVVPGPQIHPVIANKDVLWEHL